MSHGTDQLAFELDVVSQLAMAALREAWPGIVVQFPAHTGAVWSLAVPQGRGVNMATGRTLQEALEQLDRNDQLGKKSS